MSDDKLCDTCHKDALSCWCSVDKPAAISDSHPRCGICGEPMPAGEEMFKYHGLSGPCPKPPLKPTPPSSQPMQVEVTIRRGMESLTITNEAWRDIGQVRNLLQPPSSQPTVTDEQLRELAACGTHSNRYGDVDGIWDTTCRMCAARMALIRKVLALLRTAGEQR